MSQNRLQMKKFQARLDPEMIHHVIKSFLPLSSLPCILPSGGTPTTNVLTVQFPPNSERFCVSQDPELGVD